MRQTAREREMHSSFYNVLISREGHFCRNGETLFERSTCSCCPYYVSSFRPLGVSSLKSTHARYRTRVHARALRCNFTGVMYVNVEESKLFRVARRVYRKTKQLFHNYNSVSNELAKRTSYGLFFFFLTGTSLPEISHKKVSVAIVNMIPRI